MTDPSNPRIAALQPLIARVRTDVTARLVPKEGGGKSAVWDKSTPLTTETLAKHLNGGPARGVALMQPGSDVTMVAVLDLDSHKGEVPWGEMATTGASICDALSLAWGVDPIAFRSSGGRGVHIYLLWDAPQPAWAVRAWLGEVLQACELRAGVGSLAAGQVEVFPKQDSVRPGGFGNQVFLPLAGQSEPLAVEELSGMLVPAAVETLAWPSSPALPPRERPAPAAGAPPPDTGEVWRQALEALPNDAARSLSYEDWLRVVHAVHYETDGSDEGQEAARAWSSRSPKHEDGMLEKAWTHASDRDGGVTGASIRHLARRSGWLDPTDAPDPADFDVVSTSPPVNSTEPPPPAERGGMPQAQHLCTDQANANRLVKAYGSRVLVAGGRWHVWDGVRWRPDEADVYRYACRLSVMIKEEAAQVRRRARDASLGIAGDGVGGDGSTGRVEKAEKIAEALDSWGVRSESKGAIEAAIGLARKMLTVDVSMLDRDPLLLNCLNGVVDLRTGEIRRHDSGDLITKLVPVEYRGLSDDARCAAWERALLEICGGAQDVVGFLRRWFGYCATGLVREQVFVVHWGDGSNGKSVVLDTLARVLGDYAGVAAPGLIASSGRDGGDRHPTEIASLLGKRMVTAHETQEGVQLREAFVKQATGGDTMTARYMREDFFEFAPTHKLQLLTNSKPVVKGQDHGIWRRVRLVAYTQRFGTEEEVAANLATRVKDLRLLEKLSTPQALSGVLGWIVRGAIEWLRDGLREPAAVVEASERYRHEQDRVRQFAMECCELGPEFNEPLTAGMRGLFPTYTEWCREGGYHPLSRARFMHELQRVVPGFRHEDAYQRGDGGTGRRKVLRVWGLRVLQE